MGTSKITFTILKDAISLCLSPNNTHLCSLTQHINSITINVRCVRTNTCSLFISTLVNVKILQTFGK